MSISKVHKILKKNRELHKRNNDSWQETTSKYPYMQVPYSEYVKFKENGARLYHEMMDELDGVEMFPKNKK